MTTLRLSFCVHCRYVAEGIFATGSNDSLVLMYYIDVGRSALQRSPQPLCLVAASKVMCLKINSNMILVGLDDGKMQVFKMMVRNSQHTHTQTYIHTYTVQGEYSALTGCMDSCASLYILTPSHSARTHYGVSTVASGTDQSQPLRLMGST